MSNLRLVADPVTSKGELLVAAIFHGGLDYEVTYRKPIAGPGSGLVMVRLGQVGVLLKDPAAVDGFSRLAREVTDTARRVWSTS